MRDANDMPEELQNREEGRRSFRVGGEGGGGEEEGFSGGWATIGLLHSISKMHNNPSPKCTIIQKNLQASNPTLTDSGTRGGKSPKIPKRKKTDRARDRDDRF